MILAAGLGTRLRPITDERPKPLVEVLGLPLVRHALAHARRAGVERAVLNTHWLHPAIEHHLGARDGDIELSYSHEPTLLGTGGGLKKMMGFLRREDGPILVINADALIDFDVEAVIAHHLKARPLSTMVLKETPDAARYGALGVDDDGRIRAFAGRTRYDGPIARTGMFCGVHVLEPEVLDWLPDEGESCINKEGYPRIIDAGHPVIAHFIDGYFCDVGTPERLMEANLDLLAGRQPVRFVEGVAGRPGTTPERQRLVASGADIDPSARLVGPFCIGPRARIGADVEIGPEVVVGPGVEVGPRARLRRMVVLSGAKVPPDADLNEGIFGPAGFVPGGG